MRIILFLFFCNRQLFWSQRQQTYNIYHSTELVYSFYFCLTTVLGSENKIFYSKFFGLPFLFLNQQQFEARHSRLGAFINSSKSIQHIHFRGFLLIDFQRDFVLSWTCDSHRQNATLPSILPAATILSAAAAAAAILSTAG